MRPAPLDYWEKVKRDNQLLAKLRKDAVKHQQLNKETTLCKCGKEKQDGIRALFCQLCLDNLLEF